jgi:hypothetical protein
LRRWCRVLRSSLRCFFLAIRLRRFLMTEPTSPHSPVGANRCHGGGDSVPGSAADDRWSGASPGSRSAARVPAAGSGDPIGPCAAARSRTPDRAADVLVTHRRAAAPRTTLPVQLPARPYAVSTKESRR